MDRRWIAMGTALLFLVGGGVAFVMLQPAEDPVVLGSGGVSPTVASAAAPAPKAESKHPNILFIMWDTVRADHLSLYGYDKATTPKLEEWAKRSLVFEQAHAPAMWTLPSHAAMFTGLAVTSHGANAGNRWLDNHHVTVAEHLGANGFDTFGVTTNIIASSMTNLHQGFEQWHATYDRGPLKLRPAARRLSQKKLIPSDASSEISPAYVSDDPDIGWSRAVFKDAAPLLHHTLIRWLESRDDTNKPFFAYLNMMEAHTPRIPSMEARKRIMSDELIEVGLKTDLSLYSEVAYITGKREYTELELEAIRGVYDATLLELDRATNALLKDLEERGILDNTVVILTADHGEALGEHRRLEHRYSMYEELLHVPLVIHYPGQVQPGRVKHPVSTIDLFSTMIDLAGVEPPTEPVQAQSLLAAAAGRPVYSQMLDPWSATLNPVAKRFPNLDLTPWLKTYSVVIEGNKKFIRASDGAHELYDLAADNGELKNQYTEALAAPLIEELERWEASLPTYDPSKRTEGEGPEAATAEEQQMLQALGYTDEE